MKLIEYGFKIGVVVAVAEITYGFVAGIALGIGRAISNSFKNHSDQKSDKVREMPKKER